MTVATLEQAERARDELIARLAGHAGIQGIGIAVLDGGYGVKVNVRDRAQVDLPREINGVPVVVEVVGVICAW